jgi:hypothetical protein
MNTSIEPVELVLATIGVRPLISKTIEYFRKDQLEAADRIPSTIARMARQLTRGELEDVSLFETSYDATLKDLYDQWNQAQLEAMANALETNAPGIAEVLILKGGEVLDYLRQIFPRSSYQTFLGAANVVPSDVAIYQFESVLEVLENPLKVFPLMGKGAITKRQVAAVRMVYPTLSAAIDEAITNAVLDAKVAKQSYQLPPEAEIGVSRWFGNPAIPPQMSAQLQAVQAKPKEPGPVVPPAKTPHATTLAKESLTSAQRAAMGPISK